MTNPAIPYLYTLINMLLLVLIVKTRHFNTICYLICMSHNIDLIEKYKNVHDSSN